MLRCLLSLKRHSMTGRYVCKLQQTILNNAERRDNRHQHVTTICMRRDGQIDTHNCISKCGSKLPRQISKISHNINFALFAMKSGPPKPDQNMHSHAHVANETKANLNAIHQKTTWIQVQYQNVYKISLKPKKCLLLVHAQLCVFLGNMAANVDIKAISYISPRMFKAF